MENFKVREHGICYVCKHAQQYVIVLRKNQVSFPICLSCLKRRTSKEHYEQATAAVVKYIFTKPATPKGVNY